MYAKSWLWLVGILGMAGLIVFARFLALSQTSQKVVQSALPDTNELTGTITVLDDNAMTVLDPATQQAVTIDLSSDIDFRVADDAGIFVRADKSALSVGSIVAVRFPSGDAPATIQIISTGRGQP